MSLPLGCQVVAGMRTADGPILGIGKEERASMMLYRAGRALQVVGMLVLPAAIAGELAPGRPLDLRASLTLSGIGMAIFAVGYLLQQAGRPR
jgi:drug/metabolite transporter (DMT)-like permease